MIWLGGLEDLAKTIDRSKAYITKKALESYLEEYSDYLIALERLHDKDDITISSDEIGASLDSWD